MELQLEWGGEVLLRVYVDGKGLYRLEEVGCLINTLKTDYRWPNGEIHRNIFFVGMAG